MKQSKITENHSEERAKDNSKTWKAKAISRRKEKERLRKRILELEASRDLWKSKYEELRDKSVGRVGLSSDKALGHQYSLTLVWLLVEMQKYGAMSLRGCRNSLACMLLALNLSIRVPSASTIRNWVCKCGKNRCDSSAETGGDYVVYVDESIVFGSEKMLLILGVEVGKIPRTRALNHSDMEVLYVGANTEWKSEQVVVQLEKIAQHKRIVYAVSDEGNNLKKAYGELNYIHIEDCTHVLANYLKRLYASDSTFEAFRKLVGSLRKEWNLSKTKSQYMPPTMRGKMRWANIFPAIQWAIKMLIRWETLDESLRQSLSFLKSNEAYIQALCRIDTVFKTVCSILKNEGFGSSQKAKIVAQLDNLVVPKTDTYTHTFVANCKTYLDNLSQKSTTLERPFLLVSSDIIESFFGKFKHKINPNNRTGLTEFIFTIANFSQPFSIDEVKKALESIKIKDLKIAKTTAETS